MSHHRYRERSLTAHYQSRTQIPDSACLCVMSYRTRDSQSGQSTLSTITHYGITDSYPDVSLRGKDGMTMNDEILQYPDLLGSDFQTAVFYRIHLTDTHLRLQYATDHVKQ